MDEVSVKIEIVACPWKKQDKHSLMLELEADTSIREILNYLVEENKIVVDVELIDVCFAKETSPVSHNTLISDLSGHQKSISFTLTVRNFPEPSVQANQKKTPVGYKPYESQHLPQMTEPLEKKKSNHQELPYQVRTQLESPSYQPSFEKKKGPSHNSTELQTFISKESNRSIQKEGAKKIDNQFNTQREDIEFNLRYKQGQFQRKFQYSSIKAEDCSEQIKLENDSDGLISIVIVEKGRRMKFEVEKI